MVYCLIGFLFYLSIWNRTPSQPIPPSPTIEQIVSQLKQECKGFVGLNVTLKQYNRSSSEKMVVEYTYTCSNI